MAKEERLELHVGIRAAGANDLPAVLALNRFVQDLHAEARPGVFHPSDVADGASEFFRRLLEAQEASLFVAEVDRRPVGYIHVEVQRRTPGPFTRGYGRLYVHQLSVDPEFRLRGVGRALMSRAQKLAEELDLDRIALDTWSFNRRRRRSSRVWDSRPTTFDYRNRSPRQMLPMVPLSEPGPRLS